MSKFFLYDNDARTPISRQFNVYEGKPVVLKGGDLDEPVQIYVSVGQCIGCDTDFIWEPLSICGAPVELSSENTMLAIATPGVYYLGDPTVTPLVLGPTTNVIAETVSQIPFELSSTCSGPLKIDTSCEEPLHVKVCDMMEMEISDVKLGCALDAEGEAIGSVVFSRDYDEETGTTVRTISAIMYDGTVITPYSGAWGVCDEKPCTSEPVLGVITDMSLLIQ